MSVTIKPEWNVLEALDGLALRRLARDASLWVAQLHQITHEHRAALVEAGVYERCQSAAMDALEIMDQLELAEDANDR